MIHRVTGSADGPPRAGRVEVMAPVKRRRRGSTQEKARLGDERCRPGISVSLVGGRPDTGADPLFNRGRLAAQGAFTVAGAGEAVVPAYQDGAAQRPAHIDKAAIE
jgi:transposase-like protein